MYSPTLRRVLLVEDDPGDAELVVEYLAQASMPAYDIQHVSSLADAQASLAVATPDAVLLDLRLPDGTGVDCLRALRARERRLPVVVLTGLDDEALALECIAAGAQDYLAKRELEARSLGRAIAYALARSAEAQQRERADLLQTKLSAIIEATIDAIVSMTPDGRVTSWNRGAAQMFGYGADEALGRPIDEVIRAPADGVDEQRDRLAEAQRGEGVDEVREVLRLHRDGRPLAIATVTSVLRDAQGTVTDVAVICRDVTTARRQADELRRSNERLIERGRQLRALAARLAAVREEERTLISREVHDELGQLLTGIKMDMRWLARRIEARTATPDAMLARLAEAEALIDRTIATVQRIAVELRPSALDSLGLVAAVRDEARRFEARTGVRTTLEVEARLTPPPGETSTALFRILQELMTNVARHAHAQSLTIGLAQIGQGWRMEVRDDGVGIDAATAARADTLGLLGMTERAFAVGAGFAIAPAAGGGTLATVTVPGPGAHG